MTEQQEHEILGKAISDLDESKKHFAFLKKQASDLSEKASKISSGLAAPQGVRFLDSGLQMAQARGNPGITLLHQIDSNELTYDSVRQLCENVRKQEQRVQALQHHLDELRGH